MRSRSVLLLALLAPADGQWPGNWPSRYPTSPSCAGASCPCSWETFTVITSGRCGTVITDGNSCDDAAAWFEQKGTSWVTDTKSSDANSNSMPSGCVYDKSADKLYDNSRTTTRECSNDYPCFCAEIASFKPCSDGQYTMSDDSRCESSNGIEEITSKGECTEACRALGLIGSSESATEADSGSKPRKCYYYAATARCYYNTDDPWCTGTSCSRPDPPDEFRPVVCKFTAGGCTQADRYCPKPPPSASPSTAPTPSPTAPPTAGPTAVPTDAPANLPSQSPVLPTASPLGPTAPPVSPTASPLGPTAPPAPPTASPLGPTAPPVPPTVSPLGPTSPPVRTTAAPEGPTAAPAPPTTSPIGPTGAPVNPTAAPIGPTPSPVQPTASPIAPTLSPAGPTASPIAPTAAPAHPTAPPSGSPSAPPTAPPTTAEPTVQPSALPSAPPSLEPSAQPTTAAPSVSPSSPPTAAPSGIPSRSPTRIPSAAPSRGPSEGPTASPTTGQPSRAPSVSPSARPSRNPSVSPTTAPSTAPSAGPSAGPSPAPTAAPSAHPSGPPSAPPTTADPSAAPTVVPSLVPTAEPTQHACVLGSHGCDKGPGGICVQVTGDSWRCACKADYVCVRGCADDHAWHSCVPITAQPTGVPSAQPSAPPSRRPSALPSRRPSSGPSQRPSASPTAGPVVAPPSYSPSAAPSASPSVKLTGAPTAVPSAAPSITVGMEGLSTQGAAARDRLKAAPLAALAGTSGAAGAAVGMAAAGNAGKIAALANIDCVLDDVDIGEAEPLDWEFHPIGTPLGTHKHRYFLGAVVFNPLIVIAFIGLLVCVILVKTFGMGRPLAESAGDVKCPGLAYLPIMFLLQGTSLASSNMAFNPGKAPAPVAVAGWLGLAGCLFAPGLLWFTVLRDSVFRACTVPDPRLLKVHAYGQPAPLVGMKRKLYKFVFGTTVWVTAPSKGHEHGVLNTEDHFVEQLGLFFESYRGTKQWFVLAEMGNMISLSILAMIPVPSRTACHIRNAAIVALLGGFLWAIIRLRPYQSQLDNVTGVIMALLMLFAVVFSSIAILIGKPGDAVDVLLIASADLLLCSAILLMFKAMYDLGFYITDVTISRRSGVRDEFRKQNQAQKSPVHGTKETEVEMPLIGPSEDLFPADGPLDASCPSVPATSSRRSGAVRQSSVPPPGLSGAEETPRSPLQQVRSHRVRRTSPSQVPLAVSDGAMVRAGTILMSQTQRTGHPSPRESRAVSGRRPQRRMGSVLDEDDLGTIPEVSRRAGPGGRRAVTSYDVHRRRPDAMEDLVPGAFGRSRSVPEEALPGDDDLPPQPSGIARFQTEQPAGGGSLSPAAGGPLSPPRTPRRGKGNPGRKRDKVNYGMA